MPVTRYRFSGSIRAPGLGSAFPSNVYLGNTKVANAPIVYIDDTGMKTIRSNKKVGSEEGIEKYPLFYSRPKNFTVASVRDCTWSFS